MMVGKELVTFWEKEIIEKELITKILI